MAVELAMNQGNWEDKTSDIGRKGAVISHFIRHSDICAVKARYRNNLYYSTEIKVPVAQLYVNNVYHSEKRLLHWKKVSTKSLLQTITKHRYINVYQVVISCNKICHRKFFNLTCNSYFDRNYYLCFLLKVMLFIVGNWLQKKWG